MNHAITVGDVLWYMLIAGGLVGLLAIILYVVFLLNPFSSGH